MYWPICHLLGPACGIPEAIGWDFREGFGRQARQDAWRVVPVAMAVSDREPNEFKPENEQSMRSFAAGRPGGLMKVQSTRYRRTCRGEMLARSRNDFCWSREGEVEMKRNGAQARAGLTGIGR